MRSLAYFWMQPFFGHFYARGSCGLEQRFTQVTPTLRKCKFTQVTPERSRKSIRCVKRRTKFWTKMTCLDPKLVQNLTINLVQNLTVKNGLFFFELCCFEISLKSTKKGPAEATNKTLTLDIPENRGSQKKCLVATLNLDQKRGFKRTTTRSKKSKRRRKQPKIWKQDEFETGKVWGRI